MPTWDADVYLRFKDQRTRPWRELADRIALDAPRTIIDLGCGPGNSTAVLAARWPSSTLVGLDSSPDMIAAARKAEPARDWQISDIASWAAADGQRLRPRLLKRRDPVGKRPRDDIAATDEARHTGRSARHPDAG